MLQNTSATQNSALDFLNDFAHQLGRRDIDLPPFPDVYAKILEALNDPNLSMEQLARIVTAAPDLCVRILLLANSALMNRAGVEVTGIDVAVTRLGITAVRNTAASIATRDVFDIPKGSPVRYKLDTFRDMSVKTAAYAYFLASRSNLSSIKDDAMLTGLLHNVGSFYIFSKTDKYPELIDEELTRSWVPGISCALIANWGFSERIAKAVDEQNLTEESHFGGPNLNDILITSKLLAQLSNSDSPETMISGMTWKNVPAVSKLGITAENILHIIEESTEEVESFVSALV
ncbi:HDOD domain-containing protein [Thiolapillus sp.]